MRSLWRMIALRWLGGRGSHALTGDSALPDLLMMGETTHPPDAFEVRRRSAVSHRAMMSRQDQDSPIPEPVLDRRFRDDRSR